MADKQPFAPAPELPSALFAERRNELLNRIGEGVAVIAAAPELLISRDTEVPYRQASDFHYLTGFPEPESVAVITPHDPDHRFTLFVRPRDPEREVWVGARVGIERAAEAFGADAVYGIDELAARLPALLKPADTIYYAIGSDPRLDREVTEAIGRARRARQRTGSGPVAAADLESITGEMRLIKDHLEIERIRRATKISAEAHIAAMRRCRTGMGEWEVEAALESRMRELGAEGPAFASIVGSGPNATTLHYVENRRRIGEHDLVLVDAGAEWGMYAGDITRTFPASGRFTSIQRDIYQIVLAAEEAAIQASQPGSDLGATHLAAVRVLSQGLLDLRLLGESSVDDVIESGSFKRFFMHQTSHWLGLDVHDVGLYSRHDSPVQLAPGMVFTIEPGLYIPGSAEDLPEHFRGIGVRIEDDLLIVDGGHELLTRDVPVAIDEVEALVGAD